MTRFNSFYDTLDLTELKEFCMRHGKVKAYKKDDFFVHEGERCKQMGLVTKGYFKYSIHNPDGYETVTGFALTGEFVVDFHGSQMRIPSETSIIAGTYSEAIVIPAEAVSVFFNVIAPESAQRINNALFCALYHRYVSIYRLSPKEQYLQLVREGNNIIRAIPLKELASYLRITPQYLSRIRREISGDLQRENLD